MIKINIRGIQPSAPIDPALLPQDAGFLDGSFIPSPVLLGLRAGRAVAYGATGFLELADGAELSSPVLGPLTNDAYSGFYENKPGVSSGLVSYCFGNSEFVTDQIVAGVTFAPGEFLYIGTGANVGLYTNVAPVADAQVVGISASSASAASPFLTVLAK